MCSFWKTDRWIIFYTFQCINTILRNVYTFQWNTIHVLIFYTFSHKNQYLHFKEWKICRFNFDKYYINVIYSFVKLLMIITVENSFRLIKHNEIMCLSRFHLDILIIYFCNETQLTSVKIIIRICKT